jgi:hypothetical protein
MSTIIAEEGMQARCMTTKGGLKVAATRKKIKLQQNSMS